MCLPPGLRDGGPPATADQGAIIPSSAAGDGVEFRTDTIASFAEVMDLAANVVDQLKAATPRFDGGNLAPVVGIPMIGLVFVGRLNDVADTWADCAEILRGVLEKDGGKLFKVAENYRAANERTVTAIEKTDPWKTAS